LWQLHAPSNGLLALYCNKAQTQGKEMTLVCGVTRACDRVQSHFHAAYNLGRNNMEQKPLYPPKINDEVARREKRTIFPSLIWGEG